MNLESIRQKLGKIKKEAVIKALLYIISAFAAAIVIFIILVLTGVFGKIPGRQELGRIINPLASEVYSADNVLMGKYYIQNRQDLDSEEVTVLLENALLATEDIRFYKHNGIDIKSLGRVIVKSILMGDRRYGGGSTITQPLAKNLYPRYRHRFLALPANKIREMVMALRLEKLYSKREILEIYFNTIPFGENTYGLKSASRQYFNKDPDDLRVEEAALLVGMLKATNRYDPRINYDLALGRRNLVLDQMVKYGFITSNEGDSISLLPIKPDYNPLSNNEGIAPYFREYIRPELEKILNEFAAGGGSTLNLYSDGLRIYTTIDSRLQMYADTAVKSHMSYLQSLFDEQIRHYNPWKGAMSDEDISAIYLKEGARVNSEPEEMRVFTWDGPVRKEFTTMDSLKHYLQFLQAGFVAMDVRTGEIKAWTGGIDHRYFKYDHVTSKRQAGSTFKPIMYLAALEKGLSPCQFFANDSVVYTDYDNWSPRNADNTYGGYYSMKGALTNSVNTVSVKIFMKTGADTVRDYANRMGIRSTIPEGPSAALGTADISLLEMVNAYQAIANHGNYIKYSYIKRVEDKEGNILYASPGRPDGTQVTTPDNADIMVEILRNVVNRGTAGGLRYNYNIDTDIAGKTGTTQNNTDGWFIGFTPVLAAGVWVGGELRNLRFRSMQYGQGAFAAMPIWAEFIKSAYSDSEWSYLKYDTFQLGDNTREMLNCPDYLEKEPSQLIPARVLERFNFLRRIFRRQGREGE